MLTEQSIIGLPVGHDRFIVEGGSGLSGTVQVSGFKHALVSLLGAACAAESSVVIHNCPAIAETKTLVQLIQGLGGSARLINGSLYVDASGVEHGRLDHDAANAIHGSVYLAPALVARTGEAVLATGGGCQIGDGLHGSRPIEHYVNIFERYGAQALTDGAGVLLIRARRLVGCDIDLLDFTSDRALQTGPLYSGASKMALLTAAVATGPSTLHHLYPKPDVTELVAFLRRLGVEIDGDSTRRLVVHGRGCAGFAPAAAYTLMADLIEIVTWICAGAMLGNGRLRIQGPGLARAVRALGPEMSVILEMGAPVSEEGDALVVAPMDGGHPFEVLVASTGVYSDSHPFLALLATICHGRSRITETVWHNRFDYVQGLASLGARIYRDGNSAFIHGAVHPHIAGRTLRANDVRSAAVLLLAALAVRGVTTIEGARHLARGYINLPSALQALGATIRAE
jgi:UDP-N-acetylglucosamine 1-carboxyvinyltransferase